MKKISSLLLLLLCNIVCLQAQENRIVEFFGAKWHTVGFPIQGIDEMIPLKWNKKVTVEKYE